MARARWFWDSAFRAGLHNILIPRALLRAIVFHPLGVMLSIKRHSPLAFSEDALVVRLVNMAAGGMIPTP